MELTNEELDEIDARAEVATKGPWVHMPRPPLSRDDPGWRAIVDSGPFIVGIRKEQRDMSVPPLHRINRDLLFIAAAREDVPALVAEVRRLREECARKPPAPLSDTMCQ